MASSQVVHWKSANTQCRNLFLGDQGEILSPVHRFYDGLDLHTRTLHLCILDHAGTGAYDKNLPCRPGGV
jgi:hypothetical protein